jgi:2-desacetyl-2-hydroxyethyl bacteriochlorophyllide A dehydrogenase
MESLNIIFTGKEQVELQRAAVAEPGAGQVRVRATKSLISSGTECICYARLFEAGTHWDRWVQYPFSTGYNHVGIVEQVGADVTGLKPGDRVASRSQHRQYVCADAARFLPVPEGVSDEEAAWFGMACIAQNGVRRAEHELGDTVVVIGLGLLGQLVVQYTRLLGARDVIGVDTAEPRLAMASGGGATFALRRTAGEAKETVEQITSGRLADVVYDVTGHQAVFAPALGLARRFGKLILLGDTGTPSEQRLTGDVITRGLRIIGAHDNNPPRVESDHAYWTHPNMARLFFTYVQRGQMRLRELITHRYAPSQAPEAYATLLRDRSAAMGVVFDWTL